jgi:hypothetical protein
MVASSTGDHSFNKMATGDKNNRDGSRLYRNTNRLHPRAVLDGVTGFLIT